MFTTLKHAQRAKENTNKQKTRERVLQKKENKIKNKKKERTSSD
jgi:hypothetical protein